MKTNKRILMFLALILCAVVLVAASCGEKPTLCEVCNQDPCICGEQPTICEVCNQDPCICGEQPTVCEICNQDPCTCPCWACGEDVCVCDEPWLGKGTASNPLQISTAGQLADIATVVNAGWLETMVLGKSEGTVYLKLMKDIDLSEYKEGKGWIPIGMGAFPFNGVFDGNNKKISGMTINNNYAADAGTGLFGRVSGGVVKNLTIVDADVFGAFNVGGVVGFLKDGGKIENCSFSGTITSGGMPVGGVVGRIDDGGSVTNCHAAGTVHVTGENVFAGGVAGLLKDGGKIENCSFNGTVRGFGCVGGVVGGIEPSGSVKNCYATGEVIGVQSYIGGVAGQVMGSLSNCYSTAEVSGPYRVGGVVGFINEGGKVENCVALNPSVTVSEFQASRVAGDKDGTLSGSAAFSGMTVTASGVAKTPLDKGADKEDGADLSAASILVDGTLGGRFTAANGWTVQNGKLPGFGAAVNMPAHIK